MENQHGSEKKVTASVPECESSDCVGGRMISGLIRGELDRHRGGRHMRAHGTDGDRARDEHALGNMGGRTWARTPGGADGGGKERPSQTSVGL